MDSRGIGHEQYGNETDRHEDGPSDGHHYRFCELPHREPQFGKIYGIGIPDQFSDQLCSQPDPGKDRTGQKDLGTASEESECETGNGKGKSDRSTGDDFCLFSDHDLRDDPVCVPESKITWGAASVRTDASAIGMYQYRLFIHPQLSAVTDLSETSHKTEIKTLRHLRVFFRPGGAYGIRTRDLIAASDARSQLR